MSDATTSAAAVGIHLVKDREQRILAEAARLEEQYEVFTVEQILADSDLRVLVEQAVDKEMADEQQQKELELAKRKAEVMKAIKRDLAAKAGIKLPEPPPAPQARADGDEGRGRAAVRVLGTAPAHGAVPVPADPGPVLRARRGPRRVRLGGLRGSAELDLHPDEVDGRHL